MTLFRCSFSFPCFPDLPHSNENHRDEHHPGSNQLQDAHGELKEGSLEREGMLTIVKAVVDFELFETWRRKETMMLVALSTRLITCASSYLRERVWVVWNFKILMSKKFKPGWFAQPSRSQKGSGQAFSPPRTRGYIGDQGRGQQRGAQRW